MIAFPRIEGKIIDYDIIAIGHMKWTIYFNESSQNPPRGEPSTCTSTLIRGRNHDGKPYNLIVDPTLCNDPKEYFFDLNRRTGLLPNEITHCFTTHEHKDHVAGLNYFPNAQWLAPKPVVKMLKNLDFIDNTRIKEVEGEFLPGLYSLPLPGHTYSQHGVAFIFKGRKVVVAGDSVITKYHFKNVTSNETIFEDDEEMAKSNIQWLKKVADIIIPGHDNIIINY
ncbi:MBL fold metallo-hydrolase [Bacillus paramycoides]|uniref:MBL fold metallo-hydrolase n=1 Tax=Bacillus paramycoides TaxID=2026194 RepID=UPI002E1DEE48|nr:MBL fold metallo-hydrolase [Bacillus paramycoides]